MKRAQALQSTSTVPVHGTSSSPSNTGAGASDDPLVITGYTSEFEEQEPLPLLSPSSSSSSNSNSNNKNKNKNKNPDGDGDDDDDDIYITRR